MGAGIPYRVAASDIFNSPFFARKVRFADLRAQVGAESSTHFRPFAWRHAYGCDRTDVRNDLSAFLCSSEALSSRMAVQSEASSSAARCD